MNGHKMNKLLSIVIPTHNRGKYAKHAIMSILNMNLDIELVVSDTSLETDLNDFVKKINMTDYPNVSFVYRYNRAAFDMNGNHNYALSLATGDFVCLIGDDDSVTPFILSACKWMDSNNVAVLSQLVSANYVWPDFKTKFYGYAHAGRLYISKHLSKLERIESENAFNFAMNNSAQGTDGLPKLYHGIVRRTLLDDIRIKSGFYVHGSSPDFSAAIALTQVCSHFYQTTFPLTIPGASGGSNTGRSALNKHKGNLADEEQTKGAQVSWETEIPTFFSVETVWADACFKSLNGLNVEFKSKFNFYGFYAQIFLNHMDRFKDTKSCFDFYLNSRKISFSFGYYKLLSSIFYIVLKKIFSISKRLLKPTPASGKYFYEGLETVLTTPELSKKHVLTKKIKNPFDF